ncbi:MAG: Gfo/Idh/MocA family oxidoreductase [Armatimonadetes bacterium]|nr:Gfo/Idh/MocA family oxidoreductase [Armatimonadota bacterium]
MTRPITRRSFLHTTAAALAAPYVVPARALGQGDKDPANERITMGFIGVGGMGGGHLGGMVGNRGVEVLAVCDVDEERRNSAKARVGGQCAAYNDYRELLDRDDIDSVVISTPDHWHALTTINACEAGKDVYCEKPLSLTIDEALKMIDAVRRYGRVFQTGSQQRSGREFQQAVSLVRSGRIGKVHTVHAGIGGGPTSGWEPDSEPPPGLDWNLWLGPAPWVPYNKLRCFYNFRWFLDYSGGILTDWGHHHNDIAQWGLNRDGSGPVKIGGWGKFPTDGLYDTVNSFEITCTYPDGTTLVTASTGDHGIKFEGPDGWVHVDRGFLETFPAELKDEVLGPGDVRLYHDGGHQQDWLNCIKTRERPICDIEIGASSVIVCHLENIAIRLGRKLEWDPVNHRFVNHEGANRWLSRPYRAPWHL